MIIGSEEENKLIRNKLRAICKFFFHIFIIFAVKLKKGKSKDPEIGVKAFWTSGVRDRILKQFLWWDGSDFTYTNWRNRQPDNYEGLEHCVTMSVSGQWNDLNCKFKRGIICEMNVSAASRNEEEVCCDNVNEPNSDTSECFLTIAQKVTDFHQKTFNSKIAELEQMLSKCNK